jgi:hypothetical protein
VGFERGLEEIGVWDWIGNGKWGNGMGKKVGRMGYVGKEKRRLSGIVDV